MRLSLRSSGGFTGPAGAETRTVDTAVLAPADAQRLQALVEQLDQQMGHQLDHRLSPGAPPQSLLKARPQSWDFSYTLSIDNGAQRTIAFHLDAAPAPLKALVDCLNDYPPA